LKQKQMLNSYVSVPVVDDATGIVSTYVRIPIEGMSAHDIMAVVMANHSLLRGAHEAGSTANANATTTTTTTTATTTATAIDAYTAADTADGAPRKTSVLGGLWESLHNIRLGRWR
jgi:hypothetical protein